MSKNLTIAALVLVISSLIGILIITNYPWFSEGWLIGLAILIGSFAAAGLLAYIKIKR